MKKAKTVKITDNDTTSTTISKLKGGKKYFVQVRTYKTVSGTTYYSDWSKKAKIKTLKQYDRKKGAEKKQPPVSAFCVLSEGQLCAFLNKEISASLNCLIVFL